MAFNNIFDVNGKITQRFLILTLEKNQKIIASINQSILKGLYTNN